MAPSTATTTDILQATSISVALISSGAIATLSAFDLPIIQSQNASRSLPQIRWLFSRGSHIFPPAAAISSAGFTYLAFDALPVASRGLMNLLNVTSNGSKVNGYLVAALLTIGIAPFTMLVMFPTVNEDIIQLTEERGGARSVEAAKGSYSEVTDLSGPQRKTDKETTEKVDEKVEKLLARFKAQNWVRAVLMGFGGVVGLWTALGA